MMSPPHPWWSLQHRGRTAWTVHLGLLGLFALLALVAHLLRADNPDLWVTEVIQRQHGLDGLLRAVSWIGSAPQDIVIYGALTISVLVLVSRTAGAFLLGSVIGSTVLYWLVKALVQRPRPAGPHIHLLTHLESYSFPSGHVVNFVACYGFLAYVAWIRLRPTLLRAGVVILCLLLVVLIGPARIYLGAHWASDVLGAYLLGGLWLSVVLRAYIAWQERHQATG